MILLENKIVGFDQDHIDEIYAKHDDIDEMQESGDFKLEEFTSNLSDIKQFLSEMENHNQVISKYAAGSNNNFYTLWAYIHLNNPQNAIEFANSYETFMEKVFNIKAMQENGENIEGVFVHKKANAYENQQSVVAEKGKFVPAANNNY